MKNIDLNYPRPQLKRDNYIILDGKWQYKIVPDVEENIDYQGFINVPYSPEAKLSGVSKVLKPNEELWYKREVMLPKSVRKGKILLNFGAVDQICDVFINNQHVKHHVGGYTPFSCDITNYIQDKKIDVEIKVKDYTEKSELSRGKQSLKPNTIWYQCQSGIWQTVWLENVPEYYIKNVKITPDINKKRISIIVETNNDGLCLIKIGTKQYTIPVNQNTIIEFDKVKEWTPESPNLYDVDIKYGEDNVKTYFGFREIKIDTINNIPYIFLNNKPIFLNGILEQGYYKNGLYTPDTFETVLNDLSFIKSQGFNTIRKHVKIEPAIYYYLCDKLGIIVIQDMVNGGGNYNNFVVKAPLILPLKLQDNNYKILKRQNEEAKTNFEEEIHDTINYLYNFPSICMWSIFNEGWGQYDSIRLYDYVRSLDSTRIIDPCSGWYDQQYGELKSDHCYFIKYRYKKDKQNRATILSEYGGYSYGDAGGYTYKNLKSEKEYLEKIKKCLQNEILNNTNNGLCGAIYTQYNDIESEKNGIVDENRNPKSKSLKRVFNIGEVYEQK